MCKEEMLKKLEITALSDQWAELFEEVEAKAEETIAQITDEAQLVAVMDRLDLFTKCREEILQAAAEIRNNRALTLRCCLIDKALERVETHFPGETAMPMGDSLGARLYTLIPIIRRLPDIDARYRARSIPEEIIRIELNGYEGCALGYQTQNGELGFDKRYYNWMLLVMQTRLFAIGRLNFEIRKFGGKIRAFKHMDGRVIALADGLQIHKSGQVLGSVGCTDEEGAFDAVLTETEEDWIGYPADNMGRIENRLAMLSKAEWTLVLQPGDDVLSVHIPRNGALTVENCEAAYQRALELLVGHFPELDFKAFVCSSWMMDRQVGQMLKPGANITAFQNKFIPYPNKSSGKAVFNFVYQLPNSVNLDTLDYAQLPGNTSLQRSIREKYMNGGAIFENGGFFLID